MQSIPLCMTILILGMTNKSLIRQSFPFLQCQKQGSFLSLGWSKFRLCSANRRPGYWSNLPCDWPTTAQAYSKQEIENGTWCSGYLMSVKYLSSNETLLNFVQYARLHKPPFVFMGWLSLPVWHLNTYLPDPNGHHLTDVILKCMFIKYIFYTSSSAITVFTRWPSWQCINIGLCNSSSNK